MTRLHANECKAMKIDKARADVARLINQAERRHLLINGRKMELAMYSTSGLHGDRINGADRLLHCSQFSLVVFDLGRGSESVLGTHLIVRTSGQEHPVHFPSAATKVAAFTLL